MVKSRDFVNLRCWHLCRNGEIVDPSEYSGKQPIPPSSIESNALSTPVELDGWSAEKLEPLEQQKQHNLQAMHKSYSDVKINESFQGDSIAGTSTLSKSLGAKGFFTVEEDVDGDDHFADAEEDKVSLTASEKKNHSVSSENMYVSSAISIPYGELPPSPKYIR